MIRIGGSAYEVRRKNVKRDLLNEWSKVVWCVGDCLKKTPDLRWGNKNYITVEMASTDSAPPMAAGDDGLDSAHRLPLAWIRKAPAVRRIGLQSGLSSCEAEDTIENFHGKHISGRGLNLWARKSVEYHLAVEKLVELSYIVFSWSHYSVRCVLQVVFWCYRLL